MQRLVGSELAALGRRLMAEVENLKHSASVQTALLRLKEAEAAVCVRRGPEALRVNGYL